MSNESTPVRRGPSMFTLLGLVAIVCAVGAVVILSRSLAGVHTNTPGGGLTVTIPTPPAAPAQAPSLPAGPAPADSAGAAMQGAVDGAYHASAGIGQVLIAWLLTVDLILALVVLFGLVVAGGLHALHVPRVASRAVLLSVGIGELILVMVPVVLLVVMRLLGWLGGFLVAATSSSLGG